VSALALFAVGFVVSVVVFVALGLLLLGAILDGRDERARKEAEAAGAASVTQLRQTQVVPTNTQGEAA
jgi:hypothetical protein